MPSSVTSSQDETGHHMDCICEICTCGGHRCKITNNSSSTILRNSYDPINSSYRAQYIRHDAEPFKRHRPAKLALHIPSDKDHFVSEYRQIFHPHKVEPQHQKKEMMGPPLSVLPFDGTSTYRREHYARPIAQRLQRQAMSLPQKVPFEATTTHQEEFQRPALPDRDERYRSARGRNAPDDGSDRVPFDGQSTYRSEYLKKDPSALGHSFKSFSPSRDFVAAPDNRDFTTTNTNDYKGKRLPPCPVPLLQKPRPTSKHTGHVHYRRNEVMQARQQAELLAST